MHPNDATLPSGSSAPCEDIEADLCVVGGGMAGLCAALAAARHGARVVLLHDRPVLGGNASSEIRMWICGAHGADNKETGILEELQLANQYQNPGLKYTLWDAVLHGAAHQQPGLTAILNCAVAEVDMEDPSRIAAVRAWHLTRQCWIRVRARLFADCSGDAVLRLSGAATRWGRESREEFDEPAAPAQADRLTMGNSLLLQLRQIDPAQHVPFVPPSWAKRFPADEPRLLQRGTPTGHNFWWLEIGGLDDTIADADRIRDELQAIALGTWAWIKNHPDGRGHGWELEWFGALPGKRENVRYVGEHLLKQREVEAGGRFDDIIGHGGWTMDDHPPAAFYHRGAPTTFHPAPSPYGIPYRCLYSATVANLFMAGRCISATHMALSSTRVMATCALLGQAVGTAAAIAISAGCSPQAVHRQHLSRLQHTLMDDDQWLPGRRRTVPELTRQAQLSASHGDPEPLRDGIDRRQDGDWHGWSAPAGASVTLRFAAAERFATDAQELVRLRLVGDSALHDSKRMPCSFPLAGNADAVPRTLPRDLRIRIEQHGVWSDVLTITDNHRRLVLIPLAQRATAVQVVIDRWWGSNDEGRLFSLEVGAPVLAGPLEDFPWPKSLVTGGHAA